MQYLSYLSKEAYTRITLCLKTRSEVSIVTALQQKPDVFDKRRCNEEVCLCPYLHVDESRAQLDSGIMGKQSLFFFFLQLCVWECFISPL